MKNVVKSLLVGIVFVLLFHTSYAQLSLLRDVSNGMPVMANSFPDVKGSPYWGDFSMGRVIFTEKDTVKNLMVAFNAYSHQLEYRIEGNQLAYTPKMIQGFIVEDQGRQAVFKSGYDIPRVGTNRFVEVMVDGDYTLIEHKYKIMGDDPSAAYGSQRSRMFLNREELYVVKDGVVMPWKTKKKDLEAIFGDDYGRFKKLENEYGFDLKDKSAVRRLILLMNAQ
ncbi:MAG: hypothetical protein ACXIUD_14180 [Mongoliitalea sp.]